MEMVGWKKFFEVLAFVVVFAVPVILYLMEKAGASLTWIFVIGWLSIAAAALYLVLSIPWVWAEAPIAVRVWRISLMSAIALLTVGYGATKIWPNARSTPESSQPHDAARETIASIPTQTPAQNTESHGTTDKVEVKPEHHGTTDKATAKLEHAKPVEGQSEQPQPPFNTKKLADEIAEKLRSSQPSSKDIPYGTKSPLELKEITLAFVKKIRGMHMRYKESVAEQRAAFNSKANAVATQKERDDLYSYRDSLAQSDLRAFLMEYVNCCKQDAIDLRAALIRNGGVPGMRDEGVDYTTPSPDFLNDRVVLSIADDLERIANLIH